MNTKSTVSFFILFFIAANAPGQKVSFAPVAYGEKTCLQAQGCSDNSIYFFKIEKKEDKSTVKFDLDMNVQKEYKASDLKRTAKYAPEVSQLFVFNNKLMGINYEWVDKTGYFKIFEADGQKEVLIGTVTKKDFTFWGVRGRQVSNDQKYLLLGGSSGRSKEKDAIDYIVINDKLEVITPAMPVEAFSLAEKKEAETSIKLFGHYLVIENQTFVGASKPVYSSHKSHSRIFGNEKMILSYAVIDLLNQQRKEISLPSFGDVKPVTANLIYNEATEELTITGLTLTNEEKEKKVLMSGMYSYTISLKTAEVTNQVNSTVDKSVYDQFAAIKDDKGDDQKIINATKMDNGSMVFVIECYSPAQDYRDANGIQTKNPVYNNLYVASFDKTGKFQWLNKIERKQEIKGMRPGFMSDWPRSDYGSSLVFNVNGEIHILFNDDKKVNDYTIKQDGRMTNKILNEIGNLVIFPQQLSARPVSEMDLWEATVVQFKNDIFLPCLRGDASVLMKISY